MSFASYLGGSRNDSVAAVAVDSRGNVYLTGRTNSGNFPATPGSYHPQFIGRQFICGTYLGQQYSCYDSDVFVTKLSPAGAVLWSTYAGGTGTDFPMSIVVDAGENVYVAGTTDSTDFPVTANAIQKTAANGFLFELDNNGARLLYSSYLPSAGSLALNGSGDLYVAGTTASPDFPALNAIQPKLGSGDCSNSDPQWRPCADAFVMRWRTLDMKLLASTFFGGSGPDFAAGIALDQSGNVYVAGSTGSTDFPLKSPIQSTPGGGRCLNPTACSDAFVLKLTGDLQTVTYSSLLGGNNADGASGIAVDGQGSAILTGTTFSPDFPTLNAFQPHLTPGVCSNDYECTTAFVAKLNPAGSALVYSTYVGASGGVRTGAVAVDSQGTAYIVGSTYSGGYPVSPDAIQHCNANKFFREGTGFLTGLAADGRLAYSTFLGGTGNDRIETLAVSGQQVYLGGSTSSADFPVTPGAAQPIFGGYDTDGFVAVIDFRLGYTGPPRIDQACVVNAATLLPGPLAPGEIVSIFGAGLGPAVGAGAKLDGQGMVSKSLASVTVTFDGIPAPLLWAQDSQVNAIVPFALAGKSATEVMVSYQGAASHPVPAPVSATALGIFTVDGSGTGQAVAFNQDGSLNAASNPASRGSILTLWLTGGGLFNQTYSDGQIAPGGQASLTTTPLVYFGGSPWAPVLYAGQAPSLVAGVVQMNILVPVDALTGTAVFVRFSPPVQGSPDVTVALH